VTLSLRKKPGENVIFASGGRPAIVLVTLNLGQMRASPHSLQRRNSCPYPFWMIAAGMEGPNGNSDQVINTGNVAATHGCHRHHACEKVWIPHRHFKACFPTRRYAHQVNPLVIY